MKMQRLTQLNRLLLWAAPAALMASVCLAWPRPAPEREVFTIDPSKPRVGSGQLLLDRSFTNTTVYVFGLKPVICSCAFWGDGKNTALVILPGCRGACVVNCAFHFNGVAVRTVSITAREREEE